MRQESSLGQKNHGTQMEPPKVKSQPTIAKQTPITFDHRTSIIKHQKTSPKRLPPQASPLAKQTHISPIRRFSKSVQPSFYSGQVLRQFISDLSLSSRWSRHYSVRARFHRQILSHTLLDVCESFCFLSLMIVGLLVPVRRAGCGSDLRGKILPRLYGPIWVVVDSLVA